MEKDFENWNKKKQAIHSEERTYIHFSEREIWFCALGINIGFEQDGNGERFLRPVLIVKKINQYQCIGIPLTRTIRMGDEFLSLSDNDGPSTALLAQIRFFDAKRLVYFSKKIELESFEKVKIKLASLINSYPRPIHRLDICGTGEQINPITDLSQDQEDGLPIYNNPDDDAVK